MLVESWSDYVTLYGGFDLIPPPTADPNDVSLALGGQTFANLNALKADPHLGDGDYAGPAFALASSSRWTTTPRPHVTGTAGASVWSAGAVSGTADALVVPPKVLTYLPYAVYSFFQNGGRVGWIIRSAPTTWETGTAATVEVTGGNHRRSPNRRSFKLNARSVGAWGNNLKYSLVTQETSGPVPTAMTSSLCRSCRRNPTASMRWWRRSRTCR